MIILSVVIAIGRFGFARSGRQRQAAAGGTHGCPDVGAPANELAVTFLSLPLTLTTTVRIGTERERERDRERDRERE